MIAKYNNTCVISGKEIVEGETEISKFMNFWVVAEYASKDAMVAEIDSRVKAVTEKYGECVNEKGVAYSDMAEEEAGGIYRAIEQGILGLQMIMDKVVEFERQQTRMYKIRLDEGLI